MQLSTPSINVCKTVSEIVRDDYRTADVFRQWGINYCCGGNYPLRDVCAQKNISQEEVEQALQKATTPVILPGNIQFNNWNPIFLIDYIIHIHHAYLLQTLPELQGRMTTFVEGHKKKFPELENVLALFMRLSQQLLLHTEKEEATLFPYLKQIINTYNRRETYGSLFVKTMRQPLHEVVEKEHRHITNLLLQMRAAANNYVVPTHACTNYGVLLHKLKELDTDLVQHKHLENNILFPKIMDMEKELLQQ